MPIRSVQAHAPAFSITGEPVFPYRSAGLPPASFRKSALRGDLPSGSLDRAHTLPGSLSKACPAPSPSLRIPIHYSRIFPFLQGGFANFQGALRSPSGLLRCPPEITIWLCLLLQLVCKKYTNQITSTTNQVTWVTTEGFQRATGKPFGRRRSGDSPATIKIQ